MTSPLVERVARAPSTGVWIPTEKWFRLPLSLRQRCWRETDFGAMPASDELLAAIDAALKEG